MRGHLALLRAFYAARLRRKIAELAQKQPPWDEQLIAEWAALWRIPPIEDGDPFELRSASGSGEAPCASIAVHTISNRITASLAKEEKPGSIARAGLGNVSQLRGLSPGRY
jgi:hypothetical protein